MEWAAEDIEPERHRHPREQELLQASSSESIPYPNQTQYSEPPLYSELAPELEQAEHSPQQPELRPPLQFNPPNRYNGLFRQREADNEREMFRMIINESASPLEEELTEIWNNEREHSIRAIARTHIDWEYE